MLIFVYIISIARLHHSEGVVIWGMSWEGHDWWANRISQHQAKEVSNKKR
jgi:hypothetical protein